MGLTTGAEGVDVGSTGKTAVINDNLWRSFLPASRLNGQPRKISVKGKEYTIYPLRHGLSLGTACHVSRIAMGTAEAFEVVHDGKNFLHEDGKPLIFAAGKAERYLSERHQRQN